MVGAESFNTSCPALLYEYEGNCYVKCPIGTMPDKRDPRCIDSCLGVENCLSYDPYPPQNKDLNVYCPKGTCKPPFDKCFELQCFKTCPKTTVDYANICLRNCPADKPLIFNRTCVTNCPKSNPYIENNNCVTACSISNYLDNKFCINQCPKRSVVFNGTCQKNCPSDAPFRLKNRNESFCLKNCPFHTVMNNDTCHLQCPQNTPIIFNRTCITSCPIYSKFRLIIKANNIAVITCVPTCPSNFLREENNCVRKCAPGKVLFNKTCLFQCPSSHPLRSPVPTYSYYVQNTDIFCLDKCLHYQRVLNNTCYKECPKETFNYNGRCVKQCPSSHPFLEKLLFSSEFKCVDKCIRYRHDNICVDSCPSKFKYLNNTCVEHCYGNFPLLQSMTKTISGYYFKTNPICVSTCQKGMVLHKNDCLIECPANSSYLFQNVCLEKCPVSHRFIDLGNKNNCVAECNYIKFKSYCIPKCPKGLLEFNKSCVTECPPGYKFTDASYQKCLQTCPNARNGTSCLAQCPDGTYLYHAECVLECPDVAQYIINTTTIGSRYRSIPAQCSGTCPKGYYIYMDYCLPYCPKDYKYIFRRKCLPECPTSYLILIHDKENVWPSHTIYNCVPECPHNMVYENETCKTNCSPSAKYVAYKKCYNKCPNSRPLHFTYKEQHSKKTNHICMSHCPENSYKLNNTCVLYCSPNMFGFNAKCITQCPITHPYNYTKFIEDNQAYFCERSCPNGTFKMDKNCFDHCPDHTFSFINNTCLLKCPKSHYFHREIIVDTKYKSLFCVDQCPHFADSIKCVLSCPSERPFIYNGQCLNRCPSSVPLAVTSGNRHCTKICPNETASFMNKDCLKICPEKTPFIFNRKCQILCPYNYTFYETVVTGKLCREKCYNDFVLNEKECVAKCPIMKYNINGVCSNISHCPKEHPYEEIRQQGKTCTNKCLETNVLYENHCEEGCPFGYVIFNGKCIIKCPKSHPNELHESAIHYTYKIYCHSICPSGYVSEKSACIKDVNCYNSGKYIYNGTCTEKCFPNQYILIDVHRQKRECTSSCSVGYVSKNKTCIKEQDCLNSGMYIHNGTCKTECSKGHYILQSEYESKKICSLKCPEHYYHNNTHCMICKDSWVLYDGNCLQKCPKFTLQFKKTCITMAGALTGLILLVLTLLGLTVLFWCCFVHNCMEKGDFHQQVDTDDSTIAMSRELIDADETCPMELDTNATNDFPEYDSGCIDINDTKYIQQVPDNVSDTKENKTCTEERLLYTSETEQTQIKLLEDIEYKRQGFDQVTNLLTDTFDLSSETDDVFQSKKYNKGDVQKIKEKDKIDQSRTTKTSSGHLTQKKQVHSIMLESYVNNTSNEFDSITEEKRLFTLKDGKDYTIDKITESNETFDEPLVTGTFSNLIEEEHNRRKDLGSNQIFGDNNQCDLKADDEIINMASFSKNCMPFKDHKSLETQDI